MNSRMAYRTLLVTNLGLVMKARSLRREFLGNTGVAFKAKLPDRRSFQHLCVRRAVRYVANGTTLEFQRSMFENERSLFIRVTFYARGIGADRELGLLGFKTAVSVMTIAALHRTFHYFVMVRFLKLGFDLVVAAETKLRFACTQHFSFRLFSDQCHRSGWFGNRNVLWVSGVTSVTTDIISPMLPAAKIVVRLFTGVTRQAC